MAELVNLEDQKGGEPVLVATILRSEFQKSMQNRREKGLLVAQTQATTS